MPLADMSAPLVISEAGTMAGKHIEVAGALQWACPAHHMYSKLLNNPSGRMELMDSWPFDPGPKTIDQIVNQI